MKLLEWKRITNHGRDIGIDRYLGERTVEDRPRVRKAASFNCRINFRHISLHHRWYSCI